LNQKLSDQLEQKYKSKVKPFIKEPTFPKILRPGNYTLSLLDKKDIWAVSKDTDSRGAPNLMKETLHKNKDWFIVPQSNLFLCMKDQSKTSPVKSEPKPPVQPM